MHQPIRRFLQAGIVVVIATLATAGALARVHATPRDGRPAQADDNPLSRYSLPRAGEFALRGAVRERLDAGAYTYLRVHEDSGREAWVVTLRRSAVGRGRVVAWVVARAAYFDSPRLHRRFAPLFFGAVRAEEGPAAQRPGRPP